MPRPSAFPTARFAWLPAVFAAAGLALLLVLTPAPAAHAESGAHRTPPPPPVVAAPVLADER